MLRSPTVWIVDDDEDDRFLLEIALKQVIPPVRIKQLTDGAELVPCLQEAAVLPKLVLLDLNMGRMNGFDALADVRALPAFEELPIVVLSTSSSMQDRQKSLLLGADGYFTKSPNHTQTVAMLKELIDEWQLI